MTAEQPEKSIDQEVNEAGGEPEESGQTDLAEALVAAESKAAENWDRYLRAVAEADNVRKRSARDVENAHKFALERFGRELLPVTDGLEMALASSDGASVESLLEGSRATLKLLSTTMERFGVEVIDPEGEPFDPELHEAINVQPSSELEPGSVIAVIQKGYSLNGRLLRPAMVTVAEEPTAGE